MPDKKGKNNKKRNNQDTNDNTIDFSIINKFNKIKLAVPMKAEDYSKTVDNLNQLKDTLLYWGKII